MTRSPATVEALLGDERAEEGKNEEERSLAVVGGSGGDGSQGRGSVVAGWLGEENEGLGSGRIWIEEMWLAEGIFGSGAMPRERVAAADLAGERFDGWDSI